MVNSSDFLKYLELLREISGTLARLTGVQREKARVVRLDDLRGLDTCIKQEQAISMELRGYEQKRESALEALGLAGVSLSGLYDRAPVDCRGETREAVEELMLQYQHFHSASEVARNTLECNLHEIEKVLKDLGRDVENDPEIPGALHREFRA